ncbi:MAG: hypothetical protein WBS19_10760, partial [Candidatus Korobacteraceae bacterium]
MHTLFLFGIQLTVFLATTLVLVWFMTRPTPADRRLAALTQMFSVDKAQESSTIAKVRARLLRIVRVVRSRLGLTDDEKLRNKFSAAGVRDQKNMDLYFALKCLGPLAAILLWTFIPRLSFFYMTILAGLLYLAPDFWLSMLSKKRRQTIEMGLPDALDLMVVCIEAGLGLDQALMRTGQE